MKKQEEPAKSPWKLLFYLGKRYYIVHETEEYALVTEYDPSEGKKKIFCITQKQIEDERKG
jgi:hypothetical protein